MHKNYSAQPLHIRQVIHHKALAIFDIELAINNDLWNGSERPNLTTQRRKIYLFIIDFQYFIFNKTREGNVYGYFCQ